MMWHNNDRIQKASLENKNGDKSFVVSVIIHTPSFPSIQWNTQLWKVLSVLSNLGCSHWFCHLSSHINEIVKNYLCFTDMIDDEINTPWYKMFADFRQAIASDSFRTLVCFAGYSFYLAKQHQITSSWKYRTISTSTA